MTKYQFSLALLTSVFSVMSFSSSLQAACVTGDCAAMGYTKTENTCEGDIIRCPFDTSKVFCKEPTTKVCDTVGDILYDDKNCAIDINNLDPNRIPIGVVFDVNRKLAIDLEVSSYTLQWASSSKDISGLTNYTSESAAKGDYNGKSNTSIIIEHGDLYGYETPAADYCYNNRTAGTKKGDWYLPAQGELQLIYNNKTTLNNSLSKVGGKPLIADVHWSSSEYNGNSIWQLSLYNGYYFGNSKVNRGYVRPVLAY